MQLTQQIIINNKHRWYSMLDELCFKSKNLYNYALYQIRQYYKNTNKYLSYYELNTLLSKENQIDYRSLPYAQCSQQVLRQIDKQYVSFYNVLKSPKMKGKKIRLPKYKDKENGRNIVTYTNQCFKLKNNVLSLKINNNNKIDIETNLNVQIVRIIHKGNHIVIELIYNKEYKLKCDNKQYAALDLGLNNLVTLTSNVCQSVIYDGKKLKNINHFYNKRKALLQSKLNKNRKTSNRIKRINYRRNNKIKDYMHKVSHLIVIYMETNNLNTLFVGKNFGWKEGINIGKTNNQNFVAIPYNLLISMLDYKCKLAGIKMILLNEAYTSKCSFIDNEKICQHKTYFGKRIKRGLFKSKYGHKINADVNGSFNIMRLGIQKCNCDVLNIVPADKRYVYNPVRIKINSISFR